MNKKQQTLLIIGTIILMIITGIGGFILGQKFYDKEEEIKNQLQYLRAYRNIIVKFGRFVPNQQSHYDETLGVYLASDNQYAKRI